MNTEILASFFGWCSILNYGILLFSMIAILVFRKGIVPIHKSILKIDESELNTLYAKYLTYYKLLIITFNIVPYIALKLIQFTSHSF